MSHYIIIFCIKEPQIYCPSALSNSVCEWGVGEWNCNSLISEQYSIFYKCSKQMHNKKREQINYLGDFSQKIRSEQLAIASEIKKYKLNYLAKVVQKSNIDNYIRFSRELQLLIISYCKNIIYVAPENLSLTIEELTLLFDDLLRKYHQVFIKYHQKSIEQTPQQPRGHGLSELCAICGQQMKKINIDKMKSYIMNEIDLTGVQKYEDSDSSKQDQDAQFFQQVNNLLTIKQGELMKHQVEIRNYKEIALNALSYLTAIKDQFTRDSLLMPNNAWMNSAKEEMLSILKESFQGKIPPWISKMLSAFWSHYQRQIEKKRCEIGIQTDNNMQLELIQLRKKVIIVKEKLQIEQNQVKAQQKELTVLKGDKNNLEAKLDYYKKQLAKLLEQIESAKMENKLLNLKLSNSRLNQPFQKNDADKESINGSNHQLSRSYIFDARRTQKLRSKLNNQGPEERLFPKIKGKLDSKSSQHHIRTSIKVNLNLTSLSHSRAQNKKSTKKMEKISQATLTNSLKNDDINSSQNDTLQIIDQKASKVPKHSHQLTDSSILNNVIKEEFGELSIQDYKLKIKEVDQQLKTAVKQGIFMKNGKKHFSSTISQLELKRVPRNTIKPEQLENVIAAGKRYGNSLKKRTNMLKLSKIYNYLKDSGYLIKISEKEFKDSIINFKLFEPDQQSKLSGFLETKRTPFIMSKRHLYEKDSLLKRSLYEQASYQQSRFNSNSLDRSFDQSTGNNYLMVFISIQNAFIYETNLMKNHFSSSNKLDIPQQYLCQQFYDLINLFKTEYNQHYKLLCSFLRFPYQVVTNSLATLNIGNDMKYSTFQFYFQKILAIHQKCKKSEATCQHLKQFKAKLIENLQNLHQEG